MQLPPSKKTSRPSVFKLFVPTSFFSCHEHISCWAKAGTKGPITLMPLYFTEGMSKKGKRNVNYLPFFLDVEANWLWLAFYTRYFSQWPFSTGGKFVLAGTALYPPELGHLSSGKTGSYCISQSSIYAGVDSGVEYWYSNQCWFPYATNSFRSSLFPLVWGTH